MKQKASRGRSLLLSATNGAETLLELIDAPFGIHKLILAREEGMGVRGDTARDDVVLHPVNLLGFGRFGRRTGDKAAACRDIDEDNGMVVRMKIFFHN